MSKHTTAADAAKAAAKAAEAKLHRAAFLEAMDKGEVQALEVSIGGQTLLVDPREFSTGSVGFNNGSAKVVLKVGGHHMRFQVGINVTLVGSKEAK